MVYVYYCFLLGFITLVAFSSYSATNCFRRNKKANTPNSKNMSTDSKMRQNASAKTYGTLTMEETKKLSKGPTTWNDVKREIIRAGYKVSSWEYPTLDDAESDWDSRRATVRK